jgi:hypothetical protein
MGPPEGIDDYLAGLTHLRAGNNKEAVGRLHSMGQRSDFDEVNHLAFPVLAIAYQANGEHEQAQAALVKARRALDRWSSVLITGAPESLPFPWFDFIEFAVLYREAHVRLTGDLPSFDRLEEAERRALATLASESAAFPGVLPAEDHAGPAAHDSASRTK